MSLKCIGCLYTILYILNIFLLLAGLTYNTYDAIYFNWFFKKDIDSNLYTIIISVSMLNVFSNGLGSLTLCHDINISQSDLKIIKFYKDFTIFVGIFTTIIYFEYIILPGCFVVAFANIFLC